MKTPSLTLSALLLATSALIAPGAFAQDTQPADPPAAETSDADEPEDQDDVIVVRGRFIPEPLQVTSEVAAFISAEDLSRQGDSNAADALTKLPGLSVAEGRFG